MFVQDERLTADEPARSLARRKASLENATLSSHVGKVLCGSVGHIDLADEFACAPTA